MSLPRPETKENKWGHFFEAHFNWRAAAGTVRRASLKEVRLAMADEILTILSMRTSSSQTWAMTFSCNNYVENYFTGDSVNIQ